MDRFRLFRPVRPSALWFDQIAFRGPVLEYPGDLYRVAVLAEGGSLKVEENEYGPTDED